MDAFLSNAAAERLAEFVERTMLDSAMTGFYAFTLVLVRMSGLMVIGPLFGQSIVPANVRILLVLALSVLVTPSLQDQVRIGFHRLDTNQDGVLEQSEIPDHLQPRFERLLRNSGTPDNPGLRERDFLIPPEIPPTLIDYAWTIAHEFVIGFLLGLGVFTILSGLQLAGQIIDQQTGLALGEVFNPGLDVEGSLSGQLLYLLGVVVFLICPPLNGHLAVLAALLETFQTLPIGDVVVVSSMYELLRNILQQSFVLAIQVAAPILATMSLVALSMGFLGHTVPQINILVVGFAVRAMVSLVVLALSLSGMGYAVADQVPAVIDSLRAALTGVP